MSLELNWFSIDSAKLTEVFHLFFGFSAIVVVITTYPELYKLQRDAATICVTGDVERRTSTSTSVFGSPHEIR